MAYNRINLLKRNLLIVEITNKHYEAGYTTYAAVFRKYIEPVYPMSYKSYMDIINAPDTAKTLEKELKKKRANKRAEPEFNFEKK